ncbi:ATP-dependent DNA helicase PIF1-like protein [Tanacetum coccineum]
MIVLAFASSGIACLLLLAGRTAHSRFVIPLDLMENNTCGYLEYWQPGYCVLTFSTSAFCRPSYPTQKLIRSELCKYYKVFTLMRSMKVNKYSANGALDSSKQEFNRWVLAVGDGNLTAKIKEGEDEPTWIEIPERFLIKEWDTPIQQIVAETYPNFTLRQTDEEYLKERAILTPRNEDADEIKSSCLKS